MSARPTLAAVAVFGAFAAVPVVYAFAGGGGGYDVVFRQGAGLVVWSALALGYLLGVLPLARPSRAALLPVLALAALIGWTGLSLLWTDSSESTWTELARSLHYLGLLALVWSLLDRGSWRAAAAGLSAGAIVVCCIAVLSRLAPAAFPERDAVAPLDPTRLSYPLGYWNAVGAWAAMTAGIALAWGSQARRAAVRAAFGAALPVAGVAVYLSYSRGAAIGLAIAALAVLALAADRWRAGVLVFTGGVATGAAILAVRASPEIADGSGGGNGALVAAVLVAGCAVCWWVSRSPPGAPAGVSLRPPSARALAIACAAGLLLLAAVLGPQAASGLRGSFLGPEPERGADPALRLGGAGGQRSELWSSALDQFSSAPLRGTGAGTFELWFSRNSDDPAFVRDAHSLYLETLGELGLPGLALLLAFLAALAYAALSARAGLRGRARRGAAAAMLAAFAVLLFALGVDWMWETTAVAVLGLLAASVLVAGDAAPVSRPARAVPAPVRVAIVLAAVGLAAVQVPGIVTADRIGASQRALAGGDPEGAVELAEDAVSAQPWAASAHAQLALAHYSLGDSPEVESELAEAIDADPLNWRWPLLAARIDALEGRGVAAREAYRQARELRPALPPGGGPYLEPGS